MAALNYHHLRLFRAVAREGNLTRAAGQLNLSQSALSVQIQKLEAQLGQPLFERQGRRLALTEAGRIALDYADTVFETGDEMVSTLRGRPGAERQALRVGALTTLSRNFQLQFLRPLIGRLEVELVVRSGSMRELLAELEAHTLDVVLSNAAVRRDARTDLHSHLLNEQPVSLISRPPADGAEFRFPDDLATTPVVLPSLDSDIRVAFDRVLALAEVRPNILAEVDDMAMLRLLARESPGVTLAPPIVLHDELRTGLLIERHRLPEVTERFYAIVPSRRFPNPLVAELLNAAGAAAQR